MKLSVGEGLVSHERLWRYMNLAKYVSLLANECIWLARADTFRDKHEGRFPDEMRRSIEMAYAGFSDDDPSPVQDAADFQDYLTKNTFLSCWHKNLDENMVMWEIYGHRNEAVAIQTTVELLQRSIDASKLHGNFMILDDVQYESPDQVKGVLPYERCFFLKRPHFQYEAEVRLGLDTYSRFSPTKNTPEGIELPVSLATFVQSVLVHPDSSTWFVEAVSNVTRKYGLTIEVKRGEHGNM